jgi:hypothetical protein
MDVLFDNQCFYFNGKGGISKMFLEILDSDNESDLIVIHKNIKW